MNPLLGGKKSLVTGSARGIGREIALAFAREGADVALCDVQDEVEEVAEAVRGLGRESLTFLVDVGNGAEVKAAVDKVLDTWGALDILVNNAGITLDGLLVRMKEEEWDRVIEVNLKGAFHFTKAVARSMMKQRQGKILNVASVVGLTGNAGQANYAASKAGLIGFTKSVARELAPRGVNVNAIAPGFIATAMTEVLPEEVVKKALAGVPIGRMGQPSEVASAALFLASDLASYVTGQVLAVDGGMVMR